MPNCIQAAEELSPEKLKEYKDIFSFFDRQANQILLHLNKNSSIVLHRDGGGSIGAEEFDQVWIICLSC